MIYPLIKLSDDATRIKFLTMLQEFGYTYGGYTVEEVINQHLPNLAQTPFITLVKGDPYIYCYTEEHMKEILEANALERGREGDDDIEEDYFRSVYTQVNSVAQFKLFLKQHNYSNA
jgi:hypothetical protein